MKHEITCRCVLNQLKQVENPPNFKFVVFSIIKDDVVQPKIVQCPNCGILHKVTEITKSNIVPSEEGRSLITIEDVELSLPENLRSILSKNNCDLPTYEAVQHYYLTKKWGSAVTLNSEIYDNKLFGKFLLIIGENLFQVQQFEREF